MDISKLAERLANLKNKGGKKIWFRPSETPTQIRILPYPHGDKISFREVYFHYDVGGHKSIVCPQFTVGDPCPICKLADEFRTMGGKDNWEIFRKLQSKVRVYAPVLVRGKEEEGVKIWGFGTTIYEDLLKKCSDPEWGDISDPTHGIDLVVLQIPVGAPGNDTSYPKPEMGLKRKESVLHADPKKVAEIIASVPDFFADPDIFKILDYAALEKIVQSLGTSDEESTETGYTVEDHVEEHEDDTPPPAKPKAASPSSDLKGRLDALLDD